MSNLIKFTCTKCNKVLEIPEDLEEFSCLYCGERMHTADFSTEEALESNCGEELAYLRKKLPTTITGYKDLHKCLTKRDYGPTFGEYEAENREVLERLDACAKQYPAGRTALLELVCKDFVDALDQHLQNDPRWKRKSKRIDLFFETKVGLAVYLCPLVRKLGLEIAEPFREELHRQWMDRFPTERWTPGDYDTIINGFRRFKFCFITTATCLHEGKADDCAELTAFRTFRDGWLRGCPDGDALIAEYYDIAPAIVSCIEYCDDSGKCYGEIRDRWLSRCYTALQENRNADCRATYLDMVNTLKSRYLQ